jgi:hypothetical protein
VRKANGCERKVRRTLARLAKRRKQLAAIGRKQAAVGEALAEDLEEADGNLRALEEAMEALRAELQVLKEVTIPALVTAHKLIVERNVADTAIQVRRQMAASVAERE